MKNTMRKLKFLPLVLLLGIILVGCQKDSTKEWEYKYGFTAQDILGQYTFSGVEDAFESLTESEYFHICRDATISISYGSTLQFHFNCPRLSYSKTFTGQFVADDENFLIQMTSSQSSNSDDLTAYVYTNKQGKIRLHGYARKTGYSASDGEYYRINYYFDVIKKEQP